MQTLLTSNDAAHLSRRQAKTDMDAGLASAESEAAEEIRLLCRRYPRNMNAERFYEIWD